MLLPLLVAKLIFPSALGAILEDQNPRGWTFLYSVQNQRIQRERCLTGVSAEIDRTLCRRDGRDFSLALFQEELSSRSRMAREKREREIAEAERRLAAARETMQETARSIEPLEHARPKPLPELAELSRRYQSAEAEARAAQTALAEARREQAAWSAVSSAELIDTELHLFAAAQEAVPGTELVKRFEDAFFAAQGKSYGQNAWWDRSDGRVWFTDFVPRTLAQAVAACPSGYAVLANEGHEIAARAALERLRIAYENGETGFREPPREFWGLSRPDGWAYVLRPWESESIGLTRDGVKRIPMYISYWPQK